MLHDVEGPVSLSVTDFIEALFSVNGMTAAPVAANRTVIWLLRGLRGMKSATCHDFSHVCIRNNLLG